MKINQLKTQKITMETPAIIRAFNMDSLRTWFYNQDMPFPHLTDEAAKATQISDFDEIMKAADYMSNYGKVKIGMAKTNQ